MCLSVCFLVSLCVCLSVFQSEYISVGGGGQSNNQIIVRPHNPPLLSPWQRVAPRHPNPLTTKKAPSNGQRKSPYGSKMIK